MNRRTFLTRSSLALAGGLLIGDEAMELFARLTHHRKSFPSAGIGVYAQYPTLSQLAREMSPKGRALAELLTRSNAIYQEMRWRQLGDPKSLFNRQLS